MSPLIWIFVVTALLVLSGFLIQIIATDWYNRHLSDWLAGKRVITPCIIAFLVITVTVLKMQNDADHTSKIGNNTPLPIPPTSQTTSPDQDQTELVSNEWANLMPDVEQTFADGLVVKSEIPLSASAYDLISDLSVEWDGDPKNAWKSLNQALPNDLLERYRDKVVSSNKFSTEYKKAIQDRNFLVQEISHRLTAPDDFGSKLLNRMYQNYLMNNDKAG